MNDKYQHISMNSWKVCICTCGCRDLVVGGRGIKGETLKTCIILLDRASQGSKLSQPGAMSPAHQAERQSPMLNSKLTQRQEIRKKAQESEKSWEGRNSEYPNLKMEDLKKLQAEDPTLAEVIQTADWSASDRNKSVAEY